MKGKWFWIVLAALSLAFGMVQLARADGIVIPPGPPPCWEFHCPPVPPRPMAQLVIRYHHVTVTIENQLAVTHVDQVFFNPNEWPVEGTYLFPLPREAVVNEFTLWVDGQPVQGEVLDAQQARRTYEEIVSSLRDPALLEYAGQGAVRASIFPIPPQGERRIELKYTQALTAENGLVRYIYPLNTEKFSMQPLQDVSIQVEIRERQAIRAVYSPSHSVAVDKRSDNHVVAGYEAHNVLPDSDFALYYSLGESEAFHLFSYRDPGDPEDKDGFFLALLAPRPAANPEPVAKDVLLVLDRSGSMDGEKFQQAQQALRYILSHLNPQDRFYLQAFSTGVESYANGLRPAEEAAEAQAWVDRLGAVGSTDINRALLEAAAVMDAERPTYLIFLTDGLPTVGVVETQEILKNFAQAARPNLRLFAFGVGYDVDTVLLDTLAQEHHGLSTYVRPGEPIDEVVSAFYERISTPVLTNLSLDFGELNTFDVYPNPLPDLFAGSQVVIVGRYREGGRTDITLRGEINGEVQTFRFAQQAFTSDSRGDPGAAALLPRLWATRKIGYLLNQVRRNGPDKETIDQIVALSIRYGIVTEYTSYLVTEPAPFGAETRQEIVEEAYKAAETSPAAPSGEGAVNRAAQEGALQSADVAPAVGGGSSGESAQAAIRVVGARTFLLNEGVWTDTSYDPNAGETRKIGFLSKEYYDLLAARPDLAGALALGSRVIVVVDGQAYEVVEEGGGPVDLPQPAATATPGPQETPPNAHEATLTPEQIAQAITPTPRQPAQGSAPKSGGCPGAVLPVVLIVGMVLWKKRQPQRS